MPTISIDGVEVSQAIQYFHSAFPLCGPATAHVPCGDNSIPLVAGKTTVVRVYVSGTPVGAALGGVASYTDSRNTQRFLWPLAATLIPSGTPHREVAVEGLTFLIQGQDAYAGTARLDVTAFIQIPGQPPQGPSLSLNLTFEERAELFIRLVRIRYETATKTIPAPTIQEFWNMATYARRVFPVGATQIKLIGDSVEKFDGTGVGLLDNLAPGTTGAGTTGTPAHILNQLAAAEALPCKVVYVALYSLDLYIELSPGFSGVGGGHRAVICADPGATPTFAHEIGHALGLDHAPAGGAGGPDPDYPSYAPLPSGSIGEVGFEGATGDPKDPATIFDFMSYASPPWISPYHYMKLYQAIGPFSPTRPQIPPRRDVPPREVAFLTIQRLLERNIVVNLPGWVLPGPFPPISEVGEFAVDLTDSHGRLLSVTRFDVPEHAKSRRDDEAHFRSVALPWFAEAQRLRVSWNGETVFDYRIEKSAPRLAARFPAGEHLSGVVAVSWSYSTPGARVLLRYSADGGLTWLAMNLPSGAQSFEVDLNQLPGGERCCFELLASAGLRTRTVRSRFFRVDPKIPRPLMVSPGGRDVVKVSGPIELSGAVTDRGDPDSLVWTSSVDGELGRGPYLLLAGLTPGRHRIGLHVGISDELSEYTTIVVSRERREPRNKRR